MLVKLQDVRSGSGIFVQVCIIYHRGLWSLFYMNGGGKTSVATQSVTLSNAATPKTCSAKLAQKSRELVLVNNTISIFKPQLLP